jgi:mannose-6-phosphate isomerase-like protein (cupin superfamily)
MIETVIRGTEAPQFAQEGTHVIGYASPARGSEAVSAWKVALDPGAASPRHELTHGEVFIVLGGHARFDIEDRAHDLGVGDAICVPAKTWFAVSNHGTERFSAICCMAAGGQARIDGGDPFPIPWAQ